MLRVVCLLVCLACFTPVNAQAHSETPIVIMLGIDGLRADTLNRYNLPNLQALADSGVVAPMVPTMPTKTFVNFYSLATGLYPKHHGMISNRPYDRKMQRRFDNRADSSNPSWWGGEPIWVTAEKQGVNAATYFWVGSEVKIQGRQASIFKPYDQSKDYAERVQEVLQWIKLPVKQRPQLITLYFSSVDSAAHDFGVGSLQEYQALLDLDNQLASLRRGITDLGLVEQVNLVIVSDHGMVNLADDKVIKLNKKSDFADFIIPSWANRAKSVFEPFVYLFAEPNAIESAYQSLRDFHPHLQVFKRADIPKRFQLDHPERGPDLMLLADPGWSIYLSSDKAEPPTMAESGRAVATHGYDNLDASMQAMFIGSGPAFKRNIAALPFENIQVYGLLACMLNIQPAKTDGDITLVQYLLSKPCK